MHPSEIAIIETTFSQKERAKRCITYLIEENLAACAHIYPEVTSLYVWNGSLHEEKEIVARIKTGVSRVADVIEQIKMLHEYDLPEIIVLQGSIQGSQAYEKWVISSSIPKDGGMR